MEVSKACTVDLRAVPATSNPVKNAIHPPFSAFLSYTIGKTTSSLRNAEERIAILRVRTWRNAKTGLLVALTITLTTLLIVMVIICGINCSTHLVASYRSMHKLKHVQVVARKLALVCG